MTARVRSRKPRENRARLGVEMRRAFTHQIGSPQQAVGAGRSAASFGGKNVIRIDARLCRNIRCKLIAEPAQRQPGRLRHAHHVPPSRHRVTKCMQSSPRIECRPIRCCEHDTRGADRGANRARLDDPHSRSACRLIACASHDRRANHQARSFSSGGVHLSADVR